MGRHRKFSIEEVRSFLEAANKQFERGGIFLEGVRFIRDEDGKLERILCSYAEENDENNIKGK
jgi:hypothetical protein